MNMNDTFGTEGDSGNTPIETQNNIPQNVTNAFEVKAPSSPSMAESLAAGFKGTASVIGVVEPPVDYFNQQEVNTNTYQKGVEQAVNNYATNRSFENQQNIDRTVLETQQGVSGLAGTIIEGVKKAEMGINNTVEKIGKFGDKCNEKIKKFRETDARVSAVLLSGIRRVPAVAGEIVGTTGAILTGVAITPAVLAYGVGRGAYELGKGAYAVGKDLAIKGIAAAERGAQAAAELGGRLARGARAIAEGVKEKTISIANDVKAGTEIVGRAYKSAYLTESTKVGIANAFGRLKQNILTGIANSMEKKAEGDVGENQEKVLSGIKGLLLEAKGKASKRNEQRSLGLKEIRSRVLTGIGSTQAMRAV